jgi:hypothetical protein
VGQSLSRYLTPAPSGDSQSRTSQYYDCADGSEPQAGKQSATSVLGFVCISCVRSPKGYGARTVRIGKSQNHSIRPRLLTKTRGPSPVSRTQLRSCLKKRGRSFPTKTHHTDCLISRVQSKPRVVRHRISAIANSVKELYILQWSFFCHDAVPVLLTSRGVLEIDGIYIRPRKKGMRNSARPSLERNRPVSRDVRD